MSSQIPRSQLSHEARVKAAQIYRTTKWLAWIGLGILSFASSVIVGIAFPIRPEWTIQAIVPIFLFFTMWTGEQLALLRLRQLGWEGVVRENRVLIGRAGAEFVEENSRSSRWVEYAPLLVVPLIWGAIFLLLSQTVFDFYSPPDREDCIIAATFIAGTFFVIANYLFPDSLFVRLLKQSVANVWGTADADLLQNVSWSQIAQVREERKWNSNAELVDCVFVFIGESGATLQRVRVSVEHAEIFFQDVEARLNNPRFDADA